jgi:uncharacterized protein
MVIRYKVCIYLLLVISSLLVSYKQESTISVPCRSLSIDNNALADERSNEQQIPLLTKRVTDTVGMLSSEKRKSLEESLSGYEKSSGSQVVILIIPSTAPLTIEEYALQTAEKNEIGRKNIDDGILLLIAQKDRRIRIEVGKGLEGVMPDILAGRIINNVITPYFKQGRFEEGVDQGIRHILATISKEPLPLPDASSNRSLETNVVAYMPLFVLLYIGGSILKAFIGEEKGALVSGGVTTFIAFYIFPFMFAIAVGVLMTIFVLGVFQGGSSGGYGISNGGFSIGRRGGGGFSGGGGGFNGGGASGGW